MTKNRSKRILGIPDEFWIVFIIMVGFFLKIVYDINLGWSSGTLNLGTWQEFGRSDHGSGYLSVIQYYYSHHLLPDFDPRGYTGFSSPPLYYMISALILDLLCRVFQVSIGVSLRILQCINVVYVLVGECAGIMFLQKFGVKGKKMICGVLMLMFSPVFYHLSAAMDGSAMSFMLMTLTLNSILSWYYSRRYRMLVSTSIQMGLALMTSLSAAMILPPIIFMIVKAMKDGRRNDTPIKIQLRTASLIVVILGLWWPLYLTIRFGIPFLYVEAPFGMTINDSLLGRIAVPGKEILSHLHTIGNHAAETNIWGQLIKTAVVDFQALDLTTNGTRVITTVLLYLTIITVTIEHIQLLEVVLTGRMERQLSWFLIIGELSILIGYVFAAFRYPYVGTMNFRVIAPIVIFPLAGCCLFGGESSDLLIKKIISVVVDILILLISLITAFLYGYYY